MTENRQTLSKALYSAARCLADVESGRSLSAVLSRVHPGERATVQALSMYAMRHWGLAQSWRAITMQRRSQSAQLNSLIGISLLLLDIALLERTPSSPPSPQCPLGSDAPRYSPHTLVDQSVRAAKLISKAAFAPKLINAILRRFQRERDLFVTSVRDNQVAQWGYPVWWQDLIRDTYPQQWQTILSVSRAPPDLVIRVNARQASVEQIVKLMSQAGLQATALGDMAIMLKGAGPVDKLPGFKQGWWSVQDLSAQRAATLLAPPAGARVLDACSAPGGKAAHLLELADIDLTAVDQDSRRLTMVQDNLQRLGLLDESKVHLVHTDVRHSKAWATRAPFDYILADVPCTASGVVRRHPDIAWLRRESDLQQAIQLQQEILDALWPELAVSGKLLLVTCSIFEEEGEQQAQALLERHPDAVRLPAPGQVLPVASNPDTVCGQDGFFYALFIKKDVM